MIWNNFAEEFFRAVTDVANKGYPRNAYLGNYLSIGNLEKLYAVQVVRIFLKRSKNFHVTGAHAR